MQRLEVSGAVRPIYGSLGVERLKKLPFYLPASFLAPRNGVLLQKAKNQSVRALCIYSS